MSRSRVLIVVSDPADAAALPADRTVLADAYLEGNDDLARAGVTIVNLCRSYRYRTKGYYVSLLADARSQPVVPSVETIEGLADAFGLFRALQESGVPTVSVASARARRGGVAPPTGMATPLTRAAAAGGDGAAAAGYDAGEPAESAEALAYFGDCADRRFSAAALAVYREWPVPVLRLHFVREDGEWKIVEVAPVPPHQLSAAERRPLVVALENERFVVRRGAIPARDTMRASIAVLVDPANRFSPSTPETIERLEKIGARHNVHFHRVTLGEIDRLGEYDALFIRALTGVREPAFQWALRAEALDMPVIDDSQSIIRCSNKVFLEELLRREGIATPRTLVATAKTPWAQLAELGSPVVVKLPDGSFSAAVHKIGSEAEYREVAGEMFRRSPLIIAQEYLPTDFDWRVVVLGGRVLLTARYHMAKDHWQIRAEHAGTERYGRVEAVPRDEAPKEVVELALRAASLIGSGLYGVDLKESERGPVVIEINDNPNLDVGYEDAADGARIYEDVIDYFVRRIEEAAPAAADAPGGGIAAADSDASLAALRAPIRKSTTAPERRHYRPFEVAGVELEYAVVDRDLNAVSLVADALRVLAGRPTSDVELGAVGLSNEIADHVFEVKTVAPMRSLADAEDALVEGVGRFAAVLRDGWDARLMPTGMHPWIDPKRAKLWTRSNARIYQTYARLFDTATHGWMNVHAAHLNLPLGREAEAVAMYNAAVLLIPYLPAVAASSPMHDGELQDAVDSRLSWILEHQARIPESCGEIVPEYIDSLAGYRKHVLQPMYAALDRLPDAEAIRHDFFNARGAVFKLSGKRMEIRVVDTQECVKLDIAIATFIRAALRELSKRLLEGRQALPAHAVLVADFRSTVRDGSTARVIAPHLADASLARAADGTASARDVLGVLLERARRSARKDEISYLDLVERILESGTLAERIRAALLPHADDDEGFTEAARRIYVELCDCLEANEPWRGRGW